MKRISILAAVLLLSSAALAIGQNVDSSRRAALGQWWTTIPRYTADRGLLGIASWGGHPLNVVSDGVHIWATFLLGSGGQLVEFRGTDGAEINAWGGYSQIDAVLVAAGKIFFTVDDNPGLYMLSPDQNDGPVRVAHLGGLPESIAYGGSRFWTADGIRVSRITPGQDYPWNVTEFTGFSNPRGILHDGQNVWVTDAGQNTLLKLNTKTGAVLQTVPVGASPYFPVFDGKHIWVPNAAGNSVTVVDDATGNVTATLTGNGLQAPYQAAFDGKRVLVTNAGGHSVSLWNAKDLSIIGTYSTGSGSNPGGVCSDGIDFWIALRGFGGLGRF